MTSSLRMKRRTTVHGWNWRGQTAITSVAIVALNLLSAVTAGGQTLPPAPPLVQTQPTAGIPTTQPAPLPTIPQPTGNPTKSWSSANPQKIPITSGPQIVSEPPSVPTLPNTPENIVVQQPTTPENIVVQQPTPEPTSTAPQPSVPTQPILANPQEQKFSVPTSQPDIHQPAAQNHVIPVQGVGQRIDSKYDELSFEPPGPETLFSLRSDTSLQELIRQQARSRGVKGKIAFPIDVPLGGQQYQGRHWPRMVEWAEPNYLCYRRTHFEQINFERYGWDFGVIQPALCAGKFYWDVFWLPYHMGTEPFRHYESNAGYCLPGDPTPMYLYPPRLSLTGAASQAAAVTGGFVFFP